MGKLPGLKQEQEVFRLAKETLNRDRDIVLGGLQIDSRVEKAIYEPGEPVFVNVTLTNVSSKPIAIIDRNDPLKHFGLSMIYDIEGHHTDVSMGGSATHPPVAGAAIRIFLQAGTSYTRRQELTKLFPYFSSVACNATLAYLSSDDGKGSWSGELYSRPVQFQIQPKPHPELKVTGKSLGVAVKELRVEEKVKMELAVRAIQVEVLNTAKSELALTLDSVSLDFGEKNIMMPQIPFRANLPATFKPGEKVAFRVAGEKGALYTGTPGHFDRFRLIFSDFHGNRYERFTERVKAD